MQRLQSTARLARRFGGGCLPICRPCLERPSPGPLDAPALYTYMQHPDLIEKQRRVFSDAIKVYADPQPAAAAGGGGKGRK